MYVGGGECIIPPGFTPVTSGNELNTCNGIFKTGSNYKYKYDSDQFQTEYWYRYVISCVFIQKMYDGQT